MGLRRGEKANTCPRCGKRGMIRNRFFGTSQPADQPYRYCRYCQYPRQLSAAPSAGAKEKI